MNAQNIRATDTVAVAVEGHLRNMEAEGYSELEIEQEPDGIAVCFGGLRVRGENYDIALVRMAGALLNDDRAGKAFLTRIRGVVHFQGN